MPSIIKHFPFLKTIREYNTLKLKQDFVAGLTVAIIALPQSMAYAMIAGVHPKYGLYATIVPVIISALFGSSRFLISGPTNAISMVISSTMATAAVAGVAVSGMPEDQKIAILFLISFMVGLIQLAMGLAKMGGLVNFISHSVVVGFTAGAGILIAFNQLKNFLGLKIPSTPEFFETLKLTLEHIQETNVVALGIGLFTITFIIAAKKISKKIPGPLLAMVLSAIMAAAFNLESLNLKLIGSIPGTFPPLSHFPFDLGLVRSIFSSALAIAILGLVEALSISKSLASSSGDKINGSQEFVGQGLANISAAFFSGIPGSGSFTRSAVNFSSNAVTRFAGVYSGILVLLTILLFAPYAKFIPIASLAGILIVIAFNMVDKKSIAFCYRATRSDRIVLLITFFATLFLELEVAVYIGVVLSIVLFLRKVSRPQVIKVSPRAEDNKLIAHKENARSCPQILIFDVYGALFFGAMEELEKEIKKIHTGTEKIIIIRMKGVRIVDATGAHSMESFLKEAHKNNIRVIFTNVKESALKTFRNSGLLETLDEENITADTTDAIRLALNQCVDRKICSNCPKKVFQECSQLTK